MTAVLGPFRVGDQPADVLDQVVSRPGDAAPLSGFDTALVQVMRPDRTIVAFSGTLVAPNVIRSTWPAAIFSQAGLHRVRAKLTGPGSVVEHTTWIRFWVRPA